MKKDNCNPKDKDCKTCKYYHSCYGTTIPESCIKCDAYQYWEAKDDKSNN